MNAQTIARLLFSSALLVSCQPETEFVSNPAALDTKDSASGDASQNLEKRILNQEIRNGSVSFGINGMSTSLTMAIAETPLVQSFSQIDRQQRLIEFSQGTTGTGVSEAVDQNGFGILDILLVIDDSGSMTEEQANLSTKLQALLTSIGDSQWRIGIVTTDPGANNDKCLRTVIDKSDTNAAALFTEAVKVGIAGSGNERGILQARAALEAKCVATPWLRPNSNIGVIIVADEDNCSNGLGCGTEPYAKANYLTDYLKTIRKDSGQAKVYGLIYQPGATAATCPTGYNVGNIYAEAVTLTGGKHGSICDADYTTTLKQISLDLFLSLKASHKLRAVPSPNTLTVMVDQQDWTNDVKLEGDAITFTKLPPRSSKIVASYRVGVIAMVKGQTLGSDVDPATITVSIDGKALASSEFKYDAATGELTFKEQPAELSKVMIRSRPAQALPTSFSLGAKVRKGSVKVSVNGQPASDATIDESTGTVSFAKAPADAANIKIEGTGLGAPILSYPFNLVGMEVVSVMSKEDTPQPVTYTIESNDIRFPESAFQDGKIVIVRYRDTRAEANQVNLPQTPVDGSVHFKEGQGCEASAVEVKGRTVQCKSELKGSGTIDYRYAEQEPLKSVTFDEVAASESSTWTITVNDKPYKGFSRDGKTITFNKPIPIGAEIVIRVTGNP